MVLKNKKILFGITIILFMLSGFYNIQNISADLSFPDYTETILPGGRLTLGLNMKVGDEVLIEYEVISGGNLDVYFYIENSDEFKVVDNGLVVGYGIYTFTATYEDYFKIVFSNTMSVITSKVIEINLDVTLAEKTITVTSPTSGYYASIGFNIITWDFTGDIEDIYIELYKNGHFIEDITSGSIVNDGIYNWYISNGEYEDGDDYVIKIKNSEWSSAIYDLSDYFIMDFISETLSFNSVKDMEISSDNRGGYIACTITWEYTGDIDYVKIDLYKNSMFIETIENNLYNRGTHTFGIYRSDDYITSGTYQYRISDCNDNTIYDMSNYFIIATYDYNNLPNIIYNILGLICIIIIIIYIIGIFISNRKKSIEEFKKFLILNVICSIFGIIISGFFAVGIEFLNFFIFFIYNTIVGILGILIVLIKLKKSKKNIVIESPKIEVNNIIKICPSCGKKLEGRFCSDCGNKN